METRNNLCPLKKYFKLVKQGSWFSYSRSKFRWSIYTILN